MSRAMRRAMTVRQRGELNLYWVAILSALLALLAMAALMSIRYERNLFAEGWAKIGGAAPAQALIETGRAAAAGRAQPLRRCVIDGRSVVSNTDCLDQNPTSKDIAIHDTRGVEPPKPPPPPKADPESNPMVDKLIEKQLR